MKEGKGNGKGERERTYIRGTLLLRLAEREQGDHILSGSREVGERVSIVLDSTGDKRMGKDGKGRTDEDRSDPFRRDDSQFRCDEQHPATQYDVKSTPISSLSSSPATKTGGLRGSTDSLAMRI